MGPSYIHSTNTGPAVGDLHGVGRTGKGDIDLGVHGPMGDTDTQLAIIRVTSIATCPGCPEQGGQRKPKIYFHEKWNGEHWREGLEMEAAVTKVQIWGPSLSEARVKRVPSPTLSAKVTSVSKNSTAPYDLQSPPMATSFLTVQTSARSTAPSASPTSLPAELVSRAAPPLPLTPLVSGWVLRADPERRIHGK